MKRAVEEPESDALAAFLDRHPEHASCALARVEVVRAVRPHGDRGVALAHALIRQLRLVRVDDDVLADAARLEPWTLRTLDAIHLAAAMSLEDDLDVLVSYDDRLRRAAEYHRIRVASPA